MPTASEITSVVLPILVALALAGLAILVIRKGGNHRYNMFFATLYLLSGIKSLSEGVDAFADIFNHQSPLFPPTLYWQLLAGFCSLAMLPMLFLFAVSFPRPVKWMTTKPALGLLALLPSLAMAGLLVGAVLDAQFQELFVSAVPVFNLLGVTLTLAVLGLLFRTQRISKDAIERKQARYVALGFMPGFLAGWIITAIQFLHDGGFVQPHAAEEWTHALIHFLSPLGEIFAAGLVAFAILKYNILGIKPGFRVGVKSFLVGFIFALVFLSTQFIESVILEGRLFSFAGEYGSFLLSGATGIVLFKPIEKVSNGLSERLVPTQRDPTAVQTRAAEIYHTQCVQVLRDSQVTAREMTLLRSLRDQLGLTEAEARGIEESVERQLHVDAPQTGATATTAVSHIQQAAAESMASQTEFKPASASHAAKSARPAPTKGNRPVKRSSAAKKAPSSKAAKPRASGAKPKAKSAAKKPKTTRKAP